MSTRSFIRSLLSIESMTLNHLILVPLDKFPIMLSSHSISHRQAGRDRGRFTSISFHSHSFQTRNEWAREFFSSCRLWPTFRKSELLQKLKQYKKKTIFLFRKTTTTKATLFWRSSSIFSLHTFCAILFVNIFCLRIVVLDTRRRMSLILADKRESLLHGWLTDQRVRACSIESLQPESRKIVVT